MIVTNARHIFRIIPVFLSSAICAQSDPIQWGTPIMVVQAEQDALRPRITLNAQMQPVVLWGTNSPGINKVAILEGELFSGPQMIHPAGMDVVVADWQGSDVVSQGDMIHAVIKQMPENSGGIYLVSSTDGGYTWGDTLRVDHIPGYKSRFSSVALNGNGEPLVQFMRIDMQETDHRYMVSRMADGVFQQAVDVSSPFTAGEDCDCCAGQIIANGDHAIALFRDATDNVRVIWGAGSNDGGETFSQGAQLDPTEWTLNACPASGPDGIISADSVHYVWMSAAVNGAKVYIGSADRNTLATGPVVNVQPGVPMTLQQNHPRIAGSGDTLGVVWQQTATSQTEILFSWSISGPQGLSIPDTVNVELAGPQRTPDIAFANGTFHITWSEPQQNAIMYRKATLSPSIGVSEHDRFSHPAVWPVPAHDVLHLSLSLEQLTGGWIEIFDSRGVLIGTRPVAPVIDISDQPSGVYSLRIRDRNGAPGGSARYNIVR